MISVYGAINRKEIVNSLPVILHVNENERQRIPSRGIYRNCLKSFWLMLFYVLDECCHFAFLKRVFAFCGSSLSFLSAFSQPHSNTTLCSVTQTKNTIPGGAGPDQSSPYRLG